MSGVISFEVPFINRRQMNKEGYEIIQLLNADWRECVSENQLVIASDLTEQEADEIFDMTAKLWFMCEIVHGRYEQFFLD